MAAAFARDGGFITEKDLALVPDKVQWFDPISIKYRDYTVYNNPPPGMGIQQLQTLKIMEGFDLKKMGHNSVDYLAHLLEAVNLSRIDTDKYIGDPKFVNVPVDMLFIRCLYRQAKRKSYCKGERKKSWHQGRNYIE